MDFDGQPRGNGGGCEQQLAWLCFFVEGPGGGPLTDQARAAARRAGPAVAVAVVEAAEGARRKAEAALREPARAAAAWRADPAAAVAAVKAAAPEEVRTVLDDFDSVYVLGGGDAASHRRVSRVVAEWLVAAHAAAHGDPATKCLARLVLGVPKFATNMVWAGVFTQYKAGLGQHLQALGAPLAVACARGDMRAKLGGYTMPEHPLVVAERARCVEAAAALAAGGGAGAFEAAFEARSDMRGAVEHPQAWDFGDPGVRQRHERVYMHMLKLLAMALNAQFHAMMREVLGPLVVSGKGLMARNKNGSWRVTPEKGVARMECKRVTDHAAAPGCRSALNIDVLRVLGVVCAAPEELVAVMEALCVRLGGCLRVKVSEHKKAAPLPFTAVLYFPPNCARFVLPSARSRAHTDCVCPPGPLPPPLCFR